MAELSVIMPDGMEWNSFPFWDDRTKYKCVYHVVRGNPDALDERKVDAEHVG